MTRLTEQVQQRLADHIQPGDQVIDATAGNGYDTLFLASQVGPSGKVFAFDLQQIAIDNTRQHLRDNGMDDLVQLLRQDHANMASAVPAAVVGQVSLVMFNLGYLPGGDKSLITQADSTLAAMAQATQLLKVGGLLSVMLYPGHPGGQAEAKAVTQWLQLNPQLSEIDNQASVGKQRPGPAWVLLEKVRPE